MGRKKFHTRAPFGIASKRFDAIGFHPGLDPLGTLSKNRANLAPGDYNIQVKYERETRSNWNRKVEMEEFSEQLGFKNAQLLKERSYHKTCGGAGWYDIPDSVFAKKGASRKENVGFGIGKRFPKDSEMSVPGPGTYALGNLEKRQFSSRPMFERDGFVNRFKSADKPWTKPPNLYTPVDRGSINALLTKFVSKRGPYDLFTGPRDGSTIKNHFAPPKFEGPLNCFNVSPAELDIFLNHPRNQTRGRFLTEKRFGIATLRHLIDDPTQVKRNPDDPSPCTYSIERPKEWTRARYPFDQSITYARPLIPWKIFPGVGRYNPKYGTCPQKSNKESWIFKSKTGRTEYKAVEYNSF